MEQVSITHRVKHEILYLSAVLNVYETLKRKEFDEGVYETDTSVMLCMTVYCVIYRVSQEEWTKLRESVPYVKIYRYNPKHLCPKLNGYGDNGQRSLKL